ncbi:MAG TPA: hypothetical protein VNU93_10150, partial [Verrucomicrobiae bacterium]|nr:hypothetical protein [Verrucomicrobiae bacterium]
TKNTVIIIVSDTKTLEAKKAAHMLKLNGEKVKEIVWLNTLPKADWNQHKAVREFARVSKMFECYTLAHLERIIASQFR